MGAVPEPSLHHGRGDEGPLGDQGEAADDEIREWMEEYLEKFHRVVESHLEAVAEQTEVWN